MDFLNTYLTEWVDPTYAKKFWAAAKNNIIDISAFHRAYNEEIVDLGLEALFDLFTKPHGYTTSGLLKDKSSYNEIKKAGQVHPDSWALKAMAKLWVLQFVKNAQTTEQIENNKKSEEIKIKEQKYQELLNNKDTIIAKAKEMLKSIDPSIIDNLVKAKQEYAQLNKDNYNIDLNTDNAKIEISEHPDRYCLWINIDNLFNARIFEGSYIRDFSELDTIISELKNKISNNITRKTEELTNTIERQKQQNAEEEAELSRAKAEHEYLVNSIAQAQNDANNHKPVNPDTLAELYSLFINSKKKIDKAFDDASDWSDSIDGSSEVARIAAEQIQDEIVNNLADLLSKCNWASYSGIRKIAEYNQHTTTPEELATAIRKTIDSSTDQLNIEILPE